MDVAELHAAAKDRYWKGKDLAAARRLLDEGIALARSQGKPDLEKPLQYDLASFCWPGWDEPGITISDDDLAAGERAARENLRLAGLLGKEGAAMGRAWFMVGAFELATGRFEDAKASFAHSSTHAEGEDKGAAILALGYQTLASKADGEFEEALVTLRELEGDGPFYAEQLQTAARVFNVWPSRMAR